MTETRRYVPVEVVTGLLEALDGTPDEYEQAKVNMAASVIELTERTVWRGNPEWPAKFWSSEPVPVDVEEA